MTHRTKLGTDLEKDEGFTSLCQNRLEEDMQQQPCNGSSVMSWQVCPHASQLFGPSGRDARAGGCKAWRRHWSPSIIDAGMSSAALPTCLRTGQHHPLNHSPIGAQDKVSYKPKEMSHAIAIDKHKALY
jgi:hypothetical protein